MSCCDPGIIDDKEIAGVCADCEADINQDGYCIEDFCSYSPVDCETCGYQPCQQYC